MPQVPFSAGPQLREAPAQPTFQNAPDVAQGARALAAGANQAAGAVDQLVQRQDQDTAWRTQAAINQAWVKFDADSRQNGQGQNAAGYADRVQQWWKDAAGTYGKDLNPSARALVGKNLAVAQTQAYGSALQFENRELERSRGEALEGAVSAEVGRGSAGGPNVAAASAGIITELVQKYGATTGKPPEWIAQQTLRSTTALHATVISNLLQTDPTAAKQYFEANKGQIDGARYDEIGARINHVSASTEGDTTAGKVWAELGPKTDLQPVELDKLEQAARDAYPNDPARRDAALQGIRARAQAFEHAERQRASANTNAVFGMLDNGRSLAQLRATPEWNALPEKDQRQIKLSIESEQATREARAAAQEQRAYTAEQRRQQNLMLQNGDAYLRASDPEVLIRSSRDEVIATRAIFGQEGAKHLLDKWESLQKPGALSEARLDKEQFNSYAQQMGLRPNETGKNEAQKDLLITVQNRLETLISQEQKARGRAMTREEKDKLIQTEMAKQVMVSGWFFNSSVPVLQLTPSQMRSVIVPAQDRQQIAEALKLKYQQTGNQLYAPTEDNVRRLYLVNQSRAGALIPDAR